MDSPDTEDPSALIDDVDINPSLSAASKRALKSALLDGKVLSYFPGKITKVKLELELKSGYVPHSAAPRAHGPAQAEIMTLWIKEQVALGLYEQASEGCRWASCLHIAPTWKPIQTPSGPDRRLVKIRICGDYRSVNEQLVKIAQVSPHIRDQTETHWLEVLCSF